MLSLAEVEIEIDRRAHLRLQEVIQRVIDKGNHPPTLDSGAPVSPPLLATFSQLGPSDCPRHTTWLHIARNRRMYATLDQKQEAKACVELAYSRPCTCTRGFKASAIMRLEGILFSTPYAFSAVAYFEDQADSRGLEIVMKPALDTKIKYNLLRMIHD